MLADPMERDEQVLIDRDDEAIREQRWAAFVEWLHRRLYLEEFATMLLHDLSVAYAGRGELKAPQASIADFAESEGWPAVLNAIARAMSEHEAIQRVEREGR